MHGEAVIVWLEQLSRLVFGDMVRKSKGGLL